MPATGGTVLRCHCRATAPPPPPPPAPPPPPTDATAMTTTTTTTTTTTNMATSRFELIGAASVQHARSWCFVAVFNVWVDSDAEA